MASIFKSPFRQLVADYQDWKGEGVWGKTFRGFSKNAYNLYEMSLRIEEEQVDDPDPG